MAYRVGWSPRAVEDLEAIAQYIAVDSNAYAAAVVTTILVTARRLSQFPFSGRIVPELADQNIRELFTQISRIAEESVEGHRRIYLPQVDLDSILPPCQLYLHHLPCA